MIIMVVTDEDREFWEQEREKLAKKPDYEQENYVDVTDDFYRVP